MSTQFPLVLETKESREVNQSSSQDDLQLVMVMRNLLFVLAVVPLIAMLSACERKYVPGAVDAEAKEQGRAFWARSFSKCGDSYFGKTSSTVYEFKEFFFFTYHEMDGRVFTEADKLNGIEWEGTSFAQPKVHRYFSDGKWSEWFDYSPIGELRKMSVSVRKIKGQWEFGSDVDNKFVAVPCEQVPK